MLAFSAAFITFVVFSSTLQNDFVNWDDPVNFLNNLHYRGFSLSHLKWMFTDMHGIYIPLSWMSSALDYTLWGMNPVGYHLSSLLLHAANAALFYGLAVTILSQETPSASPWAALGATFFFSLHPLRVESVAWATEKRDVLSAFFLLLTWLSYLKLHSPKDPRAPLAGPIGTPVLFLCSLLSKASGMFFSAILILLDISFLHRLPADDGTWFSAKTRGVWLEKIPYVGLGVLAAGVAAFSQIHAGTAAPVASLGFSTRIALAFHSLGFYLDKLVWPFNLSPYYSLPATFSFSDPRFIFALIEFVGISALAISTRRLWPTGLMLWLMYIILVAPTSGIFQSNHALAADRYSYLPSIPVALLFGYALRWGERHASGRLERIGLTGFAGLVLLGLAFLTTRQIKVWRNSETLWRSVLKTDSRVGEAHNNLGTALRSQGRLPEATEEFKRAIACPLVPVNAYNNLGAALAEQGRLEEAIPLFRQALQADPTYVSAQSNLSRALAKQAAQR